MSKQAFIDIHRGDWPRCAKCDLPVEDFFAYEDDVTVFVAMCHNEIEHVRLTPDLLDNNIKVTMAFNNNKGETKMIDLKNATYLAGESGPTDAPATEATEASTEDTGGVTVEPSVAESDTDTQEESPDPDPVVPDTPADTENFFG